MQALDLALLVNIIGTAAGMVLYAMLGLMAFVNRQRNSENGVTALLLATASLGLVWNLGELSSMIGRDIGVSHSSPWLAALAYSALGFLPSVVVHTAQREQNGPKLLTAIAYLLSVATMLLNLFAAVSGGQVPAVFAMQMHAVGAIVLGIGFFAFNLRNTLKNRTILAAALLIFALSALHLGFGSEGRYWYVELAMHQSSLPLVFVILYQNFRFAFADLFLKRALSLVLLATIATALYAFVAVPMLGYHETHDRNDMFAAAIVLGLWIATALVYPAMHRFASRIVDRYLLGRPDYRTLLDRIESLLGESTDERSSIEIFTSQMREAITAERVEVETVSNADSVAAVESGVVIPTVESPIYHVRFTEFEGGRRLMSDELAVIESAAVRTARRIDALRVSHARCEQEFHTEEMQKLAAEAQLTALRAQINPHFLFNALTTIGYLIRNSPDKAYETLMRLTQLLRRILTTSSEMTTLGDELELVKNYLEIERARFEDKLRVEYAVSDAAEDRTLPPLVMQPLVENAIKHAISINRNGGTIRITATADDDSNGPLRVEIWDSGPGKKNVSITNGGGIGLANLRDRLKNYYGDAASLELRSHDGGMLAVVTVP